MHSPGGARSSRCGSRRFIGQRVLERVRTATGYARLPDETRGLVISGTTRFRGLDSKFTFIFKFRTDIAGPLGDITGFDGTTGWKVGIPVVRARFEGVEGLFRLDTGSDRTVSLHAPAVERYKLLSGRETAASQTGGIDGSQASRTGRLAWFEFAGRRFAALDVEFASSGEGVFSDLYTTGSIGAGLLREFRIVFDYGKRRAAFLPLNQARPAGEDAP